MYEVGRGGAHNYAHFGVEFTDDISGKLDSKSNQFVRGTSSRSLSDIVLFLLRLN